jgi:hypothetical protein
MQFSTISRQVFLPVLDCCPPQSSFDYLVKRMEVAEAAVQDVEDQFNKVNIILTIWYFLYHPIGAL